MAYVKKVWTARQGTGLDKFTVGNLGTVQIAPNPDTIIQEGTPLSAANFNDLEDRIEQGIADSGAIPGLSDYVAVGNDGITVTGNTEINNLHSTTVKIGNSQHSLSAYLLEGIMPIDGSSGYIHAFLSNTSATSPKSIMICWATVNTSKVDGAVTWTFPVMFSYPPVFIHFTPKGDTRFAYQYGMIYNLTRTSVTARLTNVEYQAVAIGAY